MPGNGKKGGRPVVRLWALALTVALVAFAIGGLYFFVRQFLKDGVWRFDLGLVNKSLATAAFFLLIVSMALTGMSYFSRRSTKPLAYRKHLGLVGFWVALSHAAVTHFLLPAVGLRPERKIEALNSDWPGVAALVLFGAMTFVSSAGIKGRLGGEAWRRLLRYGGYAGLVLAAGHAALLKWSSWANYFRTFDPVLPSLSLPLTVLAASACALRLAVWISAKRSP
jgi:DMSO/TMAO reductase YedYZ heme-binding membrane subunit